MNQRSPRAAARAESVVPVDAPRLPVVASHLPVVAPRPPVVAPHLPGLSGRSVRNLGRVHHIRVARRTVAVISALFAAAIGAGIALPAYAQAADPVMPTAPPQSLAVAATVAHIAPLARDGYGVTSPPPLVWPVNPASPIASGFGPRASPCSGCSSVHEGVDFDAGYGTPIHAIAAGTVVETNNPGWAALGVHVAIQHVIDGQTVVSAYGHMLSGSMPLHVGEAVYPGETIGLVGSTGASTGAHLHFEVRVGGTRPVDPLPWMHARLG